MSRRLQNYIRTYRKRAGLTQHELDFLLGRSSGSTSSRYERFTRQTTLANAFAYEIIFGEPLRNLFAGIYDESLHTVQRQARVLYANLRKKPTRGTARKLDLLETLLSFKSLPAKPHA